MAQTQTPVLYIPKHMALPDQGVWTNRFDIRSSSSNRIYTISQHKEKKHWGCSCPGWIHHRHCKHLSTIGVPNYEIPYEPKIEQY